MRYSAVPVDDQLMLQYSAGDLMNCLHMVVVVSLLCPNSWPVMTFRALSFGVHFCLMLAICSLNVRPLPYVTPRIFTIFDVRDESVV